MSLPKSLVSSTGCVEFAKRFLVKGMRVDLSPISVKSLLSVHHPYGLMAVMDRYPPKRFSTLLRLGRAGYRVFSKVDHYLPPKFERLMVIFNKTKQPMEFTLGRGRPLNPYLRGILYHEILQKMVPKDLILPPEDLFEAPGMIDILEHTLYRGWMDQWLNYVHWYYKVACCLDNSLDWIPFSTLRFIPAIGMSKQQRNLLFVLASFGGVMTGWPNWDWITVRISCLLLVVSQILWTSNPQGRRGGVFYHLVSLAYSRAGLGKTGFPKSSLRLSI